MNARQISFTDERKRSAFGALDSKQPGSVEWAWHVLEVLKLRWQRVESDYDEFEELLGQAEGQHIWDVVPPGNPYGSLDVMLLAEIGVTSAVAKKQVERVRLRAVGRPPKDEKDSIGIVSPKGGNNAQYTVARLERDRPDLAARVEAGELSANAAAIEAGFRPKTVTVPLTVDGATRLVLRLSGAERDEVIARVLKRAAS